MTTEAHRLAGIVRSKDPLDKLCEERLITHEGCDWLKSALDPFHDFQLDNLRGYPDISTEPTVVVKVRQSVTVHAPAGLDDDQTWDAHVMLSPVDYAQPASPNHLGELTTIRAAKAAPGLGNQAGGVYYQDQTMGGSATCGRMDGLVINTVPTGYETYTPGHCPATRGGKSEMHGIHLDDFFDFSTTDLGVYRLIYSGFEVVNTTAQISKQGSVTVYEYGNSYEMGAMMDKTLQPPPTENALADISSPNTWFRCPPNTLAEAKIMPGAHTWAAQDGCYNTAKFQTENPFQAATQRNFIFAQNDTTKPNGAGYLQRTVGSQAQDVGSFVSHDTIYVGGGSLTTPTTHFSRMNTTGAYFTGLSNETSLFITWRVGIERLPAANKPMFLALAQPSAAYDPHALVLYNLVANALPPGCPQGYNDAGKWFAWIKQNATKAIPTVYPIVRTASMIANSMGRPMIGGALGALATSLKPAAEDMAAKRLQAAARRKGQQQKKAAVGNYTKPSPSGQVRGGTNGLR
jgi:hypothetical protein